MSLLASRYASAAMNEIFAPEAKIIAERKLWIACYASSINIRPRNF